MAKQSLTVVLISMALTCAMVGCDVSKLANKGKSNRKKDLDKMIQLARAELPKEIDEYTTLKRIEKNTSGNLDFWYEVNEEGAQLCRKYGRKTLREAADKAIGNNKEAVEFAEKGLTIHHIYENKFGTHMLSFTVSPESLDGKETVGKEQSNPFAVRNVSRRGSGKTTKNDRKSSS